MHPTAPLTFHSGGTEVRRPKGAAMRDVDHAEHAAAFLSSAAQRPAALLIEGELGIGRTTAWLAIAERARLAGFQVLSARAREEETGFGFGVASALVGDVETDVLTSLPEVLRGAAERHLLHLDGGHPVDDRRAVVAAFTAIVNRLAETAPVLIAIDDVQWLDAASRDLLAFAARRLRGPVGLLLTERTMVDGAAVWLQLEQPNALSRLMLRPMDERRLQRLITERFGRSYSRPAMMRIAEVSGGNPFYAVELARLMAPSGTTASLPPALAEIVEGRIGHLDDEVRRALLAAACVDEATIDVMAAVTSTSVDRLVRLLEQPESDGVIVIDGNRVQFTHPVLAHGVYGHAQPMSRRRMHRALAELESAPARRARHMALAVANADPVTLAALDAAAAVSGRENPIVAAELLELAIGLGGDTVQRRLDTARHHLRAGDLDRCRALAESVVAVLPAGEERATAKLLVAGVMMARGEFSDRCRHSPKGGQRCGQTPGDAAAGAPVLVACPFDAR